MRWVGKSEDSEFETLVLCPAWAWKQKCGTLGLGVYQNVRRPLGAPPNFSARDAEVSDFPTRQPFKDQVAE